MPLFLHACFISESGDIGNRYVTEKVIKSVSQIKQVNKSSKYDLEQHEARLIKILINFRIDLSFAKIQTRDRSMTIQCFSIQKHTTYHPASYSPSDSSGASPRNTNVPFDSLYFLLLRYAFMQKFYIKILELKICNSIWALENNAQIYRSDACLDWDQACFSVADS